jgi:hypothetical protein
MVSTLGWRNARDDEPIVYNRAELGAMENSGHRPSRFWHGEPLSPKD